MTVSSVGKQSDGSGRRPRVVVVGAGFGGSSLPTGCNVPTSSSRCCRRPPGCSISRCGLTSPSAPWTPARCSVPLTATLRKARLVRGHAVALDPTARTLDYDDLDGAGGQLPYDRLLLAPGAVTKLPDISGLTEHAIGLKTVPEALYLRDHAEWTRSQATTNRP